MSSRVFFVCSDQIAVKPASLFCGHHNSRVCCSRLHCLEAGIIGNHFNVPNEVGICHAMDKSLFWEGCQWSDTLTDADDAAWAHLEPP